MLNLARSLLVLSILALVGCTEVVDPLPVDSSSESSQSLEGSLSKSSNCQAVEFSFIGAPISTFEFTGVVEGDLEGTASFVFDASSLNFRGATLKNSGMAEWTITGGLFMGLESFETEFDNINILKDRPGSPATLSENKGKHRAVDGVQKANLTYKGTFSQLPSPIANHDYRGVICI